ncbi:hypothetical protein GCM10027176_76060 [Actinoallomurus bryophytorum]|uniref:Uncharacterized protein n=1 Tax=Actinoallomurus bryophytorum TaxID=1490222 RepID=A0A543C199_9ACTN|nr:hypothetical protein [Actinoallomurus bryophytorum]TQL90853.1 hypothetical protein FB559_8167 [Actinoallomurus bryophytorum]
MSTLEDRYRRLLAWYPADHRSDHEQEMLGVLLAGARPDQVRPSIADTFDLLRGAVRVRLRRAVSAPDAPGWPAATAIAGFLATLLLVADGLRFAVEMPLAVSQFADTRAHTSFSLPHLLAFYFGPAPYWLAWLTIAVLAWRGARRPATLAACAVTTAQLLLALYGTGTTMWGSAYSAVLANISLPLALVVTASLLASPGPRRGAELLGRRAILGAAATAAVLVALTTSPLFGLFFPEPSFPATPESLHAFLSRAHWWSVLRLAVLLMAAVLLLVVLARTYQGRRACALLAIPAAPVIAKCVEAAAAGTIDGSAGVSRLLIDGLIGFALVMLCVRLAELPSRNRTGNRERHPA